MFPHAVHSTYSLLVCFNDNNIYACILIPVSFHIVHSTGSLLVYVNDR